MSRLVVIATFIYFADFSDSSRVNTEWKRKEKLYVYLNPASVTPAVYQVPVGSSNATWVFHAVDSKGRCPDRLAEIHLQHGALPPIVFNNETFPENFFVERTGAQRFLIPTDNSSHVYTLLLPRPGDYFTFMFVSQISGDDHLLPQGVNIHCNFQSSVVFITEEGSYRNLVPEQVLEISHLSQENIFWFEVPHLAVEYEVGIVSCMNACHLSMTGPLEYGLVNSTRVQYCTENDFNNCTLKVASPFVDYRQYLQIISFGGTSHVTLWMNITECGEAAIGDLSSGPGEGSRCTVVNRLDRDETLALQAHFFPILSYSSIEPNILLTLMPLHLTSLLFTIHPRKDIGTTLSILLDTSPVPVSKDLLHVKVCGQLLKGQISPLTSDPCASTSNRIQANSTEAEKGVIHVPYPEAGSWYLTLRLHCFLLVQSIEVQVSCDQQVYNVSVNLGVDKCVRGNCLDNGYCSTKFSQASVLYYSFCECSAGWRGYGCTDDCEAFSVWQQIEEVLLLTLSNLLFIPAIICTLQRGFYIEALVYINNMFYSLFYHACDGTGRTSKYTFCIMDVKTIQFADFVTSISSVWFTILVMVRISYTFRTILQVFGMLCFLLIMATHRFNVWSTLGPGIVGAVLLAVSWIYMCHQRRQCYPSRRRYLCYLLPGVLLSVAGIYVYMLVETPRNYRYTHSFWHCSISLSIIFFLPPHRLPKKGPFPTHAARRLLWRCHCSTCLMAKDEHLSPSSFKLDGQAFTESSLPVSKKVSCDSRPSTSY